MIPGPETVAAAPRSPLGWGDMKAITQKDLNDPTSLVLEDVADPVPGEGEILVKVHTAGVNRGDLLQARGHYPPPPGASEIIGMECSGTVVANDTGEGPAVGSEVGCLLAGGGYAELVAVPVGQTAPLPEGLSLAETGSIMEVACTAWSNLGMAAGLRPGTAEGKKVLVHGGSGGVGSFAVQMLHALGCEVAVTAGSAEKLEYCRELGASKLINYREQDFAEELKGWADVILDIMGAKYLKGNIRALAPDGQLVIIGMQGGTKAEINLAPLLPKRLSIHGTTLRARPVEGKAEIVADAVENVWPLIADGSITHRVHETFPLAEAAQAHAALDSGEVTGKLALRVTD